jgi:hypothetical protein
MENLDDDIKRLDRINPFTTLCRVSVVCARRGFDARSKFQDEELAAEWEHLAEELSQLTFTRVAKAWNRTHDLTESARNTAQPK